jgi:hypothetical protein
VPIGLVFAAVRFFLLAAYFVIAPTLFPEDCRSLWFWTTWGTTCFYKVSVWDVCFVRVRIYICVRRGCRGVLYVACLTRTLTHAYHNTHTL